MREVPEPRLIATEILVGLFRSTESGLCIGIGGHRITDTTTHDQVGIRSGMSGLTTVLVADSKFKQRFLHVR